MARIETLTLLLQSKNMLTILVLNVVAGLLLVGLSLPLIYRKIPPNYLYGFRVRRTLENKEVWYPVNEYAARRLFWVGIATVVAAVGLFPLTARVDVYAFALVAVVFIGMAISLVQSFVFLRRIPSDGDDPEARG